jgi:hypothetical protein
LGARVVDVAPVNLLLASGRFSFSVWKLPGSKLAAAMSQNPR